MNSANSRFPALNMMRGILRTLAAALEDMRYAQRRMLVLRTAPDRYAPHSDDAPDTYAEFLFRTSGVLMHEPSARARARGRGALLR
jgi:hypothetical protein